MSIPGAATSQRAGPRITLFNNNSNAASSSGSKLSKWNPFRLVLGDGYTALPTAKDPSGSAGTPRLSRKRTVQIATGLSVFLIALVILRQVGQDNTMAEFDTVEDEAPDIKPDFGLHEDMGWVQDEALGLTDLGPTAEQRYRLAIDKGPKGTSHYFTLLHDFASALPSSIATPLLYSLYQHLPPSHSNLLPEPPEKPPLSPPSMISYKTIHQTDKSKDQMTDETREWIRVNKNDGWQLSFMDDSDAWQWVQAAFGGSDVEWAWSYMHRGVLRADFLRYLLPLIRGGVYSDVDTRPLRPIEQWGQLDVEVLDISSTDGENWQSTMSTFPTVMVAVDVDVHAHPSWATGWPRPLGICQWTLSSAPNHPIFLDAARRVVNATRVVEAWEKDRTAKIEELRESQPEEWEQKIEQLKGQGRDHAMNVMEWTGPGLFSDAVFAFLLARYNVTWHRVRGIRHPLRIGDVMILPITGFSPGGQPDFQAESWESPQANVVHNFRGSWKGDGA